jgi:multidrug resistance efflux pump
MVGNRLLRRLRAARGPIALGLVWVGCVSAVIVAMREGASVPAYVAVARPQVWSVVPPYGGRVAEVRVVAGQHVAAGDVLATVEEPGLQATLTSLEAERRALEGQLVTEEADRGRRFARDLDDARTRWLDARVAVERARATLAGLDVQVRRATTPGVALAAIETDALVARRATAAAELAALEDAAAARERAYDRARKRAGVDSSGALQAALDAATTEIEVVRARIAAGALVAHAAGVVSEPVAPMGRDGRVDAPVQETFPVAGQWVEAGVPFVTLTAPDTQDAVIYVEPAFTRHLAPGASVTLRRGSAMVPADVHAVGVAVEPVPVRQRHDAAIAEWGIPVTLRARAPLLPGEALAAELPSGDAPADVRASR